MVPVGFPSGTSGLYIDAFYNQIIKMSSSCSNPVPIVNITGSMTGLAVGDNGK